MTLPHNEQKHNTNQLTLQHIGNLTYHQGNTATNYDNVNALTHHNNHYTLLYPDLVQELFNFALHNSNSSKNNASFLRNIGVNSTKSFSLDSSLSHPLGSKDSSLSPRDILFFLHIVSLYQLELRKGNASIFYASDKLAKLLGYNAKEKSNMRSTTLKLVKKLEQLGFLNVIRHKNKKGSDEVNEIVPILPDILYDKIKYESSNFNVDTRRLDNESNIQHILRTKLFTPIDLTFMKSLFDDVNVSNTQKLFYLNCIITAYKNYQITGQLSFAATSKELMRTNNISRDTLTRILKYIKNQYPDYFIEVAHNYSKSDDIDSNRYDKSIFVISINPIVIPQSFLNKDNLEVQKAIAQTKAAEEKVEYVGIDNTSLVSDNKTAKPNTYKGSQAAYLKKHPSILKKTSHNNKDIIIKESNKNIDEKNESLDTLEKNNQIKPQTFSQTLHSEHLESELCSLSSKSLKNIVKEFIDAIPSPSNATYTNASSTIQDISDRSNKTNILNNCNTVTNNKTTSKSKAINDRKNKDLRYFYPLSEKDANMLNFKANREFSTNFTNQLLLKLYIKYPEKRFKNKFTFSSYMIKALKNEHHQGPRVNNPSFRFSCNISTNEHNILESERYLTEIENSFDTNKEMQVRKKIVGLFDNIKAYEILLNSDFSYVDNVCKLTFRKKVEITMLQQETIKNTIKSVYGNKVNIQITTVTNNKFHQELAKTTEGVINESKSLSLNLSSTVWHQIRKGLIEELGESIDAVWFSKAEAKECHDTSLLTITMPTRFMADWLKNHYGYAISRISGTFGFKYIEYNY